MLYEESDNTASALLHAVSMGYRKKIDKYILYYKSRWCFSLLLIGLYFKRIVELEAFFVLTYILCMYQMQLLIEYLTPLGLPSVGEEEEDDELQFQNDFIELPTQIKNNDDEQRPLLRTSSEFHVWQSNVLSFCVGHILLFVPILDLPVYWPFLAIYFLFLVYITLIKYKKHMQKYGYSIFDFNKKK